jgi:hypothetical protein
MSSNLRATIAMCVQSKLQESFDAHDAINNTGFTANAVNCT